MACVPLPSPEGHTPPSLAVQAIATSASSQITHIVNANAAEGVDVFIHSWNPPHGEMIDAAYGVHLKGSMHQPVEYKDHLKPRSQALSIGRAAALMLSHAKRRGRSYDFCFVVRIDLVFAAPVLLSEFDHSRIWFSEHCCINGARHAHVSMQRTMASLRVCTHAPYGENASTFSTAVGMRHRLLGPCRMSQYSGGSPRTVQEDVGYFLMDWWFAAPPEVAASWVRIDREWATVNARLAALRARRSFSHYVWPILVHDLLNATRDVRFKAGVRANLLRSVFIRLRSRSSPSALGEYVTDPVGNCDALHSNGRDVSAAALLRAPVAADSPLHQLFGPRFEAMAQQCAVARLAEPLVCCGSPRHCGTQRCDPTWDSVNRRFTFARIHSASAAGPLKA
ncbi:hypothetical protein AB1Y20_014460 [Prymnesium parvum]|uniref:Uncharacterized protein n=1 Tax=Prymnesium parvum TaxID=97485 RepID=A0AB34IGU1_PRYPA